MKKFYIVATKDGDLRLFSTNKRAITFARYGLGLQYWIDDESQTARYFYATYESKAADRLNMNNYDASVCEIGLNEAWTYKKENDL